MTREKELNKRIERFKDYPQDIIIKRLNDMEKKGILKINN